MDNKRFWDHLVPPNDVDSTERVRDLFACVATMMDRQLRELVVDSLADLLDFFLIHQVNSTHLSHPVHVYSTCRRSVFDVAIRPSVCLSVRLSVPADATATHCLLHQ